MRLIQVVLATAILGAAACGKQASKPSEGGPPVAPSTADVAPIAGGPTATPSPSAVAPGAPARGSEPHASNLSPSIAAGAALGEKLQAPGMATALAQSSAGDHTASGIGMPIARSAPPLLSPEKLALALKTLQLKAAPGGQVINACGEVVTPEVAAAELGGTIDRVYVITVRGGPSIPSCYGATATIFYILKSENEGFKLMFSDNGRLAVLASAHHGVKDIAVGGPGFEFPVYHWDGMKFVKGGTIKDSEFPAPLN